MKRGRKKEDLDGSITIEASILVPFVVLIVAALIFFSLYLHDAVKLNMILHRLTKEAVNYVAYEVNPENGEIKYENTIKQSILYFAGSSKAKKENILESYCKKELEEGFFITTIPQIETEISISKVTITVHASSNIPIGWISNLFSRGIKDRVISMKKSYFKREEITRVLSVVSETGESIKGVSEAAEKVKNIVNKIR